MKLAQILLIITALILGYFAGGVYPWPELAFEAQVQITRDITIPEDNPLSRDNALDSPVRGNIKAGSKCIQTFRKGNVVSLKCEFSVGGGSIEYIK